MSTESKVVPITAETIVDTMSEIYVDPIYLDLPEGQALCHQAVSITSIVAQREDAHKFVMVIAVAEFGGRHFGSLSPMSPAEARNFAASLIHAANGIDGGGGVN